MAPKDPAHSKALEEKIKVLVDGLVATVEHQGHILSQDTQAKILQLLIRLASKGEADAYEAAVTQLMRNTCERASKLKFQLNSILVKEAGTITLPITPIKVKNSQPAPLETDPGHFARFLNRFLGTQTNEQEVEGKSDDEEESDDIYTLPKDYTWVETLMDNVLDSIMRDFNQTTDLGYSRIVALRNDMEGGTRTLDRRSSLFNNLMLWIQGLSQVIIHAPPRSFVEHCHHFEYRQYLMKKNALSVQADSPLDDRMKNALTYYTDNCSLLEDVMDINECRLLRVPDKTIMIDNSAILADCYKLLQDIIEKERKAEAIALVSKTIPKPYQRSRELQRVLNRINFMTRTFIEEVDKQGYDLYKRRNVKDALKSCYLIRIKIYNFEARKLNLEPSLIKRNISALCDLTEYIMERLQHGEYHTWAGKLFDRICSYLNWSSSSTRDAKIFSAGHLFNAVADKGQHKKIHACSELEKTYSKSMNDGTLGKIAKRHQIKP